MALSKEELIDVVKLVTDSGGIRAAARISGVGYSTLQARMARATELGLAGVDPVMEGFVIKKVSTSENADGTVTKRHIQQTKEHGEQFELPDGHTIKGVSSLVSATGAVVQTWVKTKLEPSAADTADILKAKFADWKPTRKTTTAPTSTNSRLLNLMPCNDWHIGMFAWRRETGEDWDLKIAKEQITDGVSDVLVRTPNGKIGVALFGGDLTHADNNNNQTAKSKNVLDVDGRHAKVTETAGEVAVHVVDEMLLRHEQVIVRVLQGNHDEETAVAIAWFLSAWYRNEPRVVVDCDQSLYWFYGFGKVMLAATHGHSVKLTAMPSIMAHRRAEMWGQTLYRYAHGFHIHHTSKFATEGEGVISESHQAPIPQDAWHYGAGFLSGRSLQSISYDYYLGEVGRSRKAMIDSANDNTPQQEMKHAG